MVSQAGKMLGSELFLKKSFNPDGQTSQAKFSSWQVNFSSAQLLLKPLTDDITNGVELPGVY